MENIPSRYRAYMLRLWQEDGESPGWRASLEDAHTGERHGFGSLESLFRFIAEQTSGTAHVRHDSAGSPGQSGLAPGGSG